MNQAEISNEKKLTLLLLCWLFGLFGVHRFYTGKYRTGGIQLLSWGLVAAVGFLKDETYAGIPLGLLFIWWVIDVMQIIMGRFTDKEGKLIVDWV